MRKYLRVDLKEHFKRMVEGGRLVRLEAGLGGMRAKVQEALAGAGVQYGEACKLGVKDAVVDAIRFFQAQLSDGELEEVVGRMNGLHSGPGRVEGLE